MDKANPIGTKLLKLRTEKGETQEQVADSIGISYVSLSRYETGQRMPKMNILSRLADHYGVTVDEIMGRKKPFTSTLNFLEGLEPISMPVQLYLPEQIENPSVVSTVPRDADAAFTKQDDIQEMVRIMYKLTPEDRQKLLDMARVMFPDAF
jgi:transcriptional regulator with XRE-family HTH domain